MPLLSGKLGGSRLVLADLGPAVGTPTGGEATSEDAGSDAHPSTPPAKLTSRPKPEPPKDADPAS